MILWVFRGEDVTGMVLSFSEFISDTEFKLIYCHYSVWCTYHL